MKIHIVKKGETLGKIARLYQVNVQKLLAANPHIKSPDQVLPRTKVKVPTAGVPLKPKQPALPMEEKQWQPASHTVDDIQPVVADSAVDEEKITEAATADEDLLPEREMPEKQMENPATDDTETYSAASSGADVPHYSGYSPLPGYPAYYPAHMSYNCGCAPYTGYLSSAGYAPYAYGGWSGYPQAPANTMNWPGYYPAGAAWGQQHAFYAHPVQRMYHLPDWWNPDNDDGEDS